MSNYSVSIPTKTHRLYEIFLLFFSFLGFVFLLNPFVWSNPVAAIPDAFKQRQFLTGAQTGLIFTINPEKNLATFTEKTAALIGSIFFQPPAVADVSNYLVDTSSSAQTYFSNPLNHLLYDPISSCIWLTLSLLGFVLLTKQLINDPINNGNIFILLFSFLILTVFLASILVIPFQRYY